MERGNDGERNVCRKKKREREEQMERGKEER